MFGSILKKKKRSINLHYINVESKLIIEMLVFYIIQRTVYYQAIRKFVGPFEFVFFSK